MPRSRRKKRELLWKESDKRCYWCGVETVFPESGRHEVPPADNMATVEHLRSKFHKERYELNNCNERRLVLACLRCNAMRAQIESRVVDEEPVIIRGGACPTQLNITSGTSTTCGEDEANQDRINR